LGDLSNGRDQRVGVAKIDNKVIGDGEIGQMTKRLSDLYGQRTAPEAFWLFRDQGSGNCDSGRRAERRSVMISNNRLEMRQPSQLNSSKKTGAHFV
jgi:hypothetical protein